MRLPWLVVLISTTAYADETNRNLFPIGEQETLRANAGIAGSSPGSVFHNPAGLAWLTSAQLAVSGTTLMYFRSTTDRLLQLDEAVPYEASGFAPIPASLVSTYRVGDYSLATAILVPDLFQLDNRQSRDTAMAHVEILQSIHRQDLWLGGSIARTFGDKLALGLSVFGVKRSSIASTFFQITLPAQPGMLSQSNTNETVDILGVSAVVGLEYVAAPWLTVGLRVEPPFLQLTGAASVYQAQVSSDGMTTNLGEVDETPEIHQPVPADVGIGFAIKPANNATIYVDAALQLPQRFTSIDDPALGPPERIHLRPAPRGSLGADVKLLPKLTLSGGVMVNRAALRDLKEPGDSVEDYAGGTLGATWTSGRTRTGVGAMVVRSSAKLVPVFAAPGDVEPAHTTVLGGLITVAYLL